MNDSLLEVAIALSNRGAYSLVAGHLVDAIGWTSRALNILAGIRHQCRLAAFGGGMYFPSATGMVSLMGLYPHPPLSYTDAWQCDVSVPLAGMHFVYNRPMVLPTHLDAFFNTEHYDAVLHIICQHVTFNLALACHRLGIELGATAVLKQAKWHYMTLLAPSSCVLENSLGLSDVSLLLCCLIHNNLACLHFEDCEYDESEYHFQSMYTSLLRCSASLSSCSGHSVYLSPHETDELILNGTLLCRPLLAHAA